jgi:hypothetical protein
MLVASSKTCDDPLSAEAAIPILLLERLRLVGSRRRVNVSYLYSRAPNQTFRYRPS